MIPRVAAVVALVSAAASARADPVPATVRLAWVRGDGADGCPDGASLQAEVSRRLRREPFDDDGPRSIEAVVERRGGAWRATLRVRDRGGALLGERVLTDPSPSCAAVADASALAVALAVDPDAVIDDAPRPAPSPARPRTRAPRSVEPAVPPVGVAVFAGLSAGITPRVAAVVGLAGDLALAPRWSLRARLDAAPAQTSDDGTLAVGFTRATLDACGIPWRATGWELAACAGLSGALVHAAVRSGRALDGGDAAWLGAGLALGLRWSPGGRWFVAVEAEGAAALLRTTWRYRPDDAVIVAQPLISGGGGLAVGLRAP